ncbi:hypothetical protein C2845_PM08G28670 [Panicum miliaceum]|uniref:F-box domain-containing protein n=1 Tax=Panicum miliaceum TaxID=4540 RepID=A0A3L6QZ56_PANMI|nr:hypothetical protein C2845_PM08G28670 [Panicum miliaceum]
MAANRCLSDLPDDLLRHILSFAPAKEATATAMISRRWRSLWRTCGAVSLDSRSYGRRLNNGETCDGFFRGAEAALAAARAPLRKLTLYVELEEHEDRPEPETLPSRSGAAKQELHGMIGALLSKPAARRVEELRIGAQLFVGASMGALTGCGFHELRFGAHHPSEALRVLHVTNCIRFTPAPPGTPFPRLAAEIRLRDCRVSRKELQGLIDAAPLLATLHLESVSLSTDEEKRTPFKVVQCYRLRCPAVTALDGIALDVPRLRYLRFKGFVALERLSLKSYAPFLDRVDLHFLDKVYSLRDEDSQVRTPCWQFLRNFNNAKVLKLKLGYPIDHIVIAEEELGDILGGKLFSKLERLELEGTYGSRSEAPGFAIASLLHCRPVVRDLRLKLSKMRPRLRAPYLHLYFAKVRAQSDFDESADHFRHRRILLDEDGDDNYEEVSDISGLREHSFNCMRKHLRRVSLEFRMKKPNCFVAQLAKFFAETQWS